MELQTMRTRLTDLATRAAPIHGAIKIVIGEQGAIYWDGTGNTPLFPDTCTVGATITTDPSSFEKLMTGKSKVKALFLLGRLKVDGDMALAMRASEVF